MLGRLFRKTSKASAPPEPPAPSHTVIVPASATEGESYKLVGAVVDFTNFQHGSAQYRSDELPPKLMQAYHADYYLAQVNNGGHSQFIHNAGTGGPLTFENALKGLRAMGAEAQAETLSKMMAWVAANKADAAAQTRFSGGRSEALDALDRAFYDAENVAPMSALNAAWIKSWPELRIVADDDYRAALQESATLNPKREDRQIGAEIRSCEFWLSDPLRAALGLAGTSAAKPEFIAALGAGTFVELDGERVMQLLVSTTRGKRFAVQEGNGLALYERIEKSAVPDLDQIDPASHYDAISNYSPPERGEQVSSVSEDMVTRTVALATELSAGAATDLLLRKIGKRDGDVSLSLGEPPEGAPERLRVVALTGGAAYLVYLFDEGAAIAQLAKDATIAGKASRAEIEAHCAKRDL